MITHKYRVIMLLSIHSNETIRTINWKKIEEASRTNFNRSSEWIQERQKYQSSYIYSLNNYYKNNIIKIKNN